jgi:hypothetical protein
MNEFMIWKYKFLLMMYHTFASFTGEGVVVVTGSSITADQTQFLLLSRYGTFLLLGIGKTVNRVTATAIDAARRRQIFSTCQIYF